jgi:hypothetical protein
MHSLCCLAVSLSVTFVNAPWCGETGASSIEPSATSVTAGFVRGSQNPLFEPSHGLAQHVDTAVRGGMNGMHEVVPASIAPQSASTSASAMSDRMVDPDDGQAGWDTRSILED